MMVLFALWYFQPVVARTWLHACFTDRLHSCAACWRHTWTSARVTASGAPPLPAPATEVSQQCRACEEMRNNTMAWSAVECRVLVCDGLVYLVVFHHSTGTHLAARMLCLTITQLRSPHYDTGERMPCSTLERSGFKCCTFEAMCNHTAHGMTSRAAQLHGACCARGQVPWCRGSTRACRVISWKSCLPSASASQTSTPTRSFAGSSSLPPCHSPPAETNHISTDCDVLDYVDPGTDSESGSCLTRRAYFACARLLKCKNEQKT